MLINFNAPGTPPRSLAARIVGAVFAVLAIGAAMMFSVVLFAGLALAALALWGYLWWKTRALRRTLREEMRAQGFATPNDDFPHRATGGANVIEGEAVRVEEEVKRLE
ncbi:MAG: hypothetical protein LBU46_05825 [Candidatus Accumulibacter sp.]|jgi:predicted lipid-binding transport protein (Tim44 family)|nr:hypothetical protein [Accumulibacter sp.]